MLNKLIYLTQAIFLHLDLLSETARALRDQRTSQASSILLGTMARSALILRMDLQIQIIHSVERIIQRSFFLQERKRENIRITLEETTIV